VAHGWSCPIKMNVARMERSEIRGGCQRWDPAVVGRNSEAYCAGQNIASLPGCQITAAHSYPEGAGFSRLIFLLFLPLLPDRLYDTAIYKLRERIDNFVIGNMALPKNHYRLKVAILK
jgi:hypothetical protein